MQQGREKTCYLHNIVKNKGSETKRRRRLPSLGSVLALMHAMCPLDQNVSGGEGMTFFAFFCAAMLFFVPHPPPRYLAGSA
jgi:hypothetical protein